MISVVCDGFFVIGIFCFTFAAGVGFLVSFVDDNFSYALEFDANFQHSLDATSFFFYGY